MGSWFKLRVNLMLAYNIKLKLFKMKILPSFLSKPFITETISIVLMADERFVYFYSLMRSWYQSLSLYPSLLLWIHTLPLTVMTIITQLFWLICGIMVKMIPLSGHHHYIMHAVTRDVCQSSLSLPQVSSPGIKYAFNL